MKVDLKDTVENVKQLKMQYLFDSTEKTQIFQIENSKKYSADPCW